jgi:hypothetical protein
MFILLSLFALLLGLSNARYLVWGAATGVSFDGYAYVTNLENNQHTQLSFTNGLRSFGLTHSYLFWCYYNSSISKTFLGRATRDGDSGNFVDIRREFLNVHTPVHTIGYYKPNTFNDFLFYLNGFGSLIRLNGRTGEQITFSEYKGKSGGGFNGGLVITDKIVEDDDDYPKSSSILRSNQIGYFATDKGTFSACTAGGSILKIDIQILTNKNTKKDSGQSGQPHSFICDTEGVGNNPRYLTFINDNTIAITDQHARFVKVYSISNKKELSSISVPFRVGGIASDISNNKEILYITMESGLFKLFFLFFLFFSLLIS